MPDSGYQSFTRRVLSGAASRLRRYAELAEARNLELQLRDEGSENARSIPTWTSKDELEALYRLGAGCPENGSIVEIGSYLGASTCFLGAGAPASVRITCVDTWQNETMPDGLRDTFAEFQRNTAGLGSRVHVIRKASAEVQPSDLPESIHLALIDADLSL